MKKGFLVLVLFFFIGLLSLFLFHPVQKANAANEKSEEEIEQELTDQVNKQIGQIDFSELDRLVEKLIGSNNGFFGSTSFIGKVKELLSGKFTDGYNNVFAAILALLFDELLAFVPILATVAAVAVLGSLIHSIKPMGASGVGDLIHFVCYGVIVVFLVRSVAMFLTMTTGLIASMQTQMQVLFPILLTLTATMGGIVSSKAYQPAVVVLSSFMIQLITTVLIPIFIFCFIFTILSNISSTVKLNKFAAFLQSLFKWVIGVVFTVFMAYLSLQGITAGMHDGISVKTAKYAIRSHVPILGGFLSEGFDFILAGSQVIRSAVGTAGLFLMFATVILPVLKIAIFSLGLKLVAAICEPICDERITNFISGVAKILSMLIVCILAVAFAYFILVFLILMSASVL